MEQLSLTLPSPAKLLDEELKLRKLQLLAAKRKQQRVLRARQDYQVFSEYTLRDESTDEFIKLSAVHKDWVRHIHESFSLGKHPVICAPMGLGKTTHFGLGIPLFALGQDTSLRILLACASIGMSRDRIQLIGDYIENSDEYHEVFPHVQPDFDKGWTKQQLFLQRRTMAKEPSIQGAGIGSTINGRRLDLVICDDLNDDKNTLHQPRTREMIWTTYRNTIMSRLEPGGRVILIQTRWHDQDIVGMLMGDPHLRRKYCFLIQRVSHDFERIECEVLMNEDVGKFVQHRSELHKLFALSQSGAI